MRIFVMRHCERNLDDCSFESPLLSIGIEHCKYLFKKMNKLNIDLLYSSPFLRAIQTLDYYSKMKEIPIYIDYNLSEYMDMPDKHLMSSKYNYVIQNEWRKEYNIIEDIEKAQKYDVYETEINMFERVLDFMNNIVEKYKNENKNILISTHMSIVNVLLFYYNMDKSSQVDENFDVDKYYPMGEITELNIEQK